MYRCSALVHQLILITCSEYAEYICRWFMLIASFLSSSSLKNLIFLVYSSRLCQLCLVQTVNNVSTDIWRLYFLSKHQASNLQIEEACEESTLETYWGGSDVTYSLDGAGLNQQLYAYCCDQLRQRVSGELLNACSFPCVLDSRETLQELSSLSSLEPAPPPQKFENILCHDSPCSSECIFVGNRNFIHFVCHEFYT